MEREENDGESRRGGREVDVDMEDDPSVQRKGRGFDPRSDGQGPKSDGVKDGGKFDVLDASPVANAEEDVARSIEGYIVIVTGIDEEATEEEVVEKFADFGKVQNCHLNLDRRTGYVKGYALLEYERLEEANEAIDACRDGLTLMDKPLKAGFAFVQPPAVARDTSMTAARGARARNRSRSPSER